MALNKTFTCNTIVDENNNAIDCYYQGYHVRTNTWNNVRKSNYQQYSCNLGDGDWLTQTGEAFSGDKIILVFWDSEEDYRSGIKNRLSSIEIILTSESTYINDVQLKPKDYPICGFYITDNSPTIDNEIETYDFSTDDTSFIYNDLTHYQYRILENELIFDSIGEQNIKYDWDVGEGFVEEYSHIYETIGDYNVSQNVTNQYGLSKICTQSIRVKYNSPIPGIIFDYTSPIHTTETATISGNINDVDSRISNIDYKVVIREYDNTLISDNIIEQTQDKNYSYEYTISVLKKHYFTEVIYWNDGYNDKTIYYSKEMPIENWCPEVSIIKQDINALDKIFKQDSYDKDGVIISYEWKIYFIPPFSDGNYVEVYNESRTTADDFEVGFTVGGNYKVEVVVKDDFLCSAFDSTEFVIEADCPQAVSSCISNIKFIFPKQLGHD